MFYTIFTAAVVELLIRYDIAVITATAITTVHPSMPNNSFV